MPEVFSVFPARAFDASDALRCSLSEDDKRLEVVRYS